MTTHECILNPDHGLSGETLIDLSPRLPTVQPEKLDLGVQNATKASGLRGGVLSVGLDGHLHFSTGLKADLATVLVY